MFSDPAPTSALLGYARDVGEPGGLESQIDVFAAMGIETSRVYTDTGSAVVGDGLPSRPGLAALLDYARRGDTVVVIGVDRLGRTPAEVLTTTRTFTDRGLGLRSLREGVDTADPAGAMVVGVLASLARLDDETPTRPSTARRHTTSSTMGRPRALDPEQIHLAEQMRANGDAVPAIAAALGVSRATLYRALGSRRAAGNSGSRRRGSVK